MAMKTRSNDDLVYLDQNILGLLNSGKVRLDGADYTWVFSDIHFEEIAHGSRTDLLDELARINARRIEPELVDWKLTGNAFLQPHNPPAEDFAHFIENTTTTRWNPSAQYDVMATLFGSKDTEALATVPERTWENIVEMFADFPDQVDLSVLEPDAVLVPARELLGKLAAQPVELESNRKALGLRGITNLLESHENPLQKIWEIVEPSMPGVTADQFFGAVHLDDGEWKQSTPFVAVIGAYVVLNQLGFRPDKNLAKSSSWANIMSDARHCATASHCAVFLTADRRLRLKAEAIYRYFGIPTIVPEVVTPPEGESITIEIR